MIGNYRDIILAPVITEKSSRIAETGNRIVFKVRKDANKTQIKQAIEKIYNVKVTKVNTLNVKPKKKRVGRYVGTTVSYKKAIVTLAEGSNIEL
jgi:large subunit ribosomal protein L23